MKPIHIIIPILLALTAKSFGQHIEQKDSSRYRLINVAKEIMTAAGTCALITLDENDFPIVRAMDPFLPESDLTVWFGTNPNSRKVHHIKNNPNVTLYYLDSDTSGYVVIHGAAQLINDLEEKENRWKAQWEPFYPKRPEDYSLIKVSPVSMEIISFKRGITGDPATWLPSIVHFTTKK